MTWKKRNEVFSAIFARTGNRKFNLDSSQFKFTSFITAKGVLKHNIEISSWFKRWVQWCSCWRVHILVWVLLQDIWPRIRLSRTVQRRCFIVYEFCFTCFKAEYKQSYIFHILYIVIQWNNSRNLDMDLRFGSLQPINCCFRSLKRKASIFKACKQALFSRLQRLTDLFRPFSYRQKKNMN